MNIEGLTIKDIDEKIRHYVTDYFKGSTIINYAGELFTENYTLQFDEIAVDLPEKHLFKDTDNINNASGCIHLADISEEHRGYEYNIILLSNADYTKVLYLILQKISEETNEAEHIILKNFMESEGNINDN
jgi:hypothetical protein